MFLAIIFGRVHQVDGDKIKKLIWLITFLQKIRDDLGQVGGLSNGVTEDVGGIESIASSEAIAKDREDALDVEKKYNFIHLLRKQVIVERNSHPVL